ncbi:MAG: glycosyl hydrolase family 28-related protein [Solirubrobacteraceae bacterium]
MYLAALSENNAAAAATAVTAINVKDSPYNAAGNGITDDKTAIQAALNDVPTSGGAVYFPPGDYLVGGPLAPKSRTLMSGSHIPRWQGLVNPESACKIRMSGSFTGTGLIVPAGSAVAVKLRNLALVGNNVGSGRHGLRMPDASAAAGEGSWELEDVTIAGFSGDGIYGRVHIAILTNCFIHNNQGWGINASNGNSWNDAHVANCYVYYNKAGNLSFGGTEVSAGIEFVNCRFERAGTNPANVLSPLNPSAPGVRLASARLVEFVNCNTDGNCGNGFEIVNEATSPTYRPDHISMVNCRLSRDGTGDQSTLGNYAGLKVKGANTTDRSVGEIKCVNCVVVNGRPPTPDRAPSSARSSASGMRTPTSSSGLAGTSRRRVRRRITSTTRAVAATTVQRSSTLSASC